MNKPSDSKRGYRFGCWLTETRKKLGLSQDQVASRGGFKRQQWGLYEKGNPCHRSTVIRIAEALGVKPEDALEAAGYSSVGVTESERRTKEIKLTGPILSALEATGGTVEVGVLQWMAQIQESVGLALHFMQVP